MRPYASRSVDGLNPRDAKFELAREIVARFHGAAAGEESQADFVRRFRDRGLPADLETVELAIPAGGLGITQLLRQAQLVASNTEAVRMIEQGAVRIDGERVSSRDLMLTGPSDLVLQVGKRRFKRVCLRAGRPQKIVGWCIDRPNPACILAGPPIQKWARSLRLPKTGNLCGYSRQRTESSVHNVR